MATSDKYKVLYMIEGVKTLVYRDLTLSNAEIMLTSLSKTKPEGIETHAALMVDDGNNPPSDPFNWTEYDG